MWKMDRWGLDAAIEYTVYEACGAGESDSLEAIEHFGLADIESITEAN